MFSHMKKLFADFSRRNLKMEWRVIDSEGDFLKFYFFNNFEFEGSNTSQKR